jgi:epoxide hydrolase-like predicted phosphatase
MVVLLPGLLSNNLSTNLEIPNDHAEKLLSYGFEKIKRGMIDENKFWAIVEKAYGSSIPASKRDIWEVWENIRPIPEMIDLIAWIKDRGIQVSLLSKTEPPVAKLLREHGAYDLFSEVVLSCEVGYAKPDPEVYEIALARTATKPEACLFIDDQQKMLEPAINLGFKTIRAETTAQTIADIKGIINSQVDRLE